ncbi:hypothetical protein AWM75_06795 [Aerococcus urinaehominis]|uniref:Uncharacterized protein n=1 Tax=Aerococcus urinaehominis TaxID=128944 RepID=A0A0X8FLV2_9LACT|nr:ferredoxin [Aerococcus urinaehominis]AMB99708.1 hypothetical protein AWM75_06795 [Aerococcus urinaehominis]SDL91390.1 ferredoxin [Aerococcus urinaehominis]
MKAYILPDQCIACGICQLKAPELFEYDDQGVAYFKASPDPYQITLEDYQLETFKAALTKCPTGAIQRSKH